MKHFVIILGVCLGAMTASADPIRDTNMVSKSVGWIDNGGEYCHVACEDRLAGSLPEHERMNQGEIGGTFLCTSVSHAHGGRLYGNNFFIEGQEPMCQITTPEGITMEFPDFRCLCVD